MLVLAGGSLARPGAVLYPREVVVLGGELAVPCHPQSAQRG